MGALNFPHHGLQPLTYLVAMSSCPVGSVTNGTVLESFMIAKYIRGDPGLSHLSGKPIEAGIALQAAGQYSMGIDFLTQKAQHLRYLIRQILTINKQYAGFESLGQLYIPGECRALFRPATANEVIISDTVVVDGVISQNTQPLG